MLRSLWRSSPPLLLFLSGGINEDHLFEQVGEQWCLHGLSHWLVYIEDDYIGGIRFMSCVTIVHRCGECKREFSGGWAEQFCPDCKVVRQRRFARDWARKQKEMEASV